MEKPEKLGFTDEMVLVCRKKDGTLKWKIDTSKNKKSNSMTKTGMAQVAGLILTDIGGTAFDYIGIGTSGAEESADHTNLQAPVKRKTATGTRITVLFTNDTAQLLASFSSADGLSGSHTVAEAGVFTAVVAGVMLFRKIFEPQLVDWDAGETLQVTAKCQIKQGA